ncbi:MAG: OsmC family protein [Theionarchaea archaeon]|nr:OsmC family protein [Theionarchaea archaeon]MBU7001736.1 OsmC family protein [Theionarchaea archaeon]MBU7020964.1 OsmC family protein [Theionarchaea archaeon]MBU7034398.1 OsmC family protein [Theionarchaea archaeon]MBU7040039.1 OsmC family protein [Theionarchaea archaeon]
MQSYTAAVIWKTEKRGTLKIEGKPDLEISPPPEFGGHEGIHSPEELFVASVSACTMATFLAFAEKTRTKFNSFECFGKGILDQVEGQLRFTRIDLTVKVEVPSEREKKHALHVLDLVSKHCLVTNSINCVVNMQSEVLVC